MQVVVLLSACLVAVCSSSAHADEDRSPQRWESAIVAFEKSLHDAADTNGATLFVGSSSIRLWNLGESFPGRKSVNHGFGGSETSDAVHFFDRIVTPVQPAVIVLYAGDNDIAKGKSPATVHADFLKFVNLKRDKLPPQTRLFYIAIKPSIKRWEMRQQMQEANAAIQQSCDHSEDLVFVDVWTPMLGDNGQPRAELFARDGLHLNDRGYELWTGILQGLFEQSKSEQPAAR